MMKRLRKTRQGYTIKRNRESIIQIIPPNNLGLKTYKVTAIKVNAPEDIPEEYREYLDFEDLKRWDYIQRSRNINRSTR